MTTTSLLRTAGVLGAVVIVAGLMWASAPQFTDVGSAQAEVMYVEHPQGRFVIVRVPESGMRYAQSTPAFRYDASQKLITIGTVRTTVNPFRPGRNIGTENWPLVIDLDGNAFVSHVSSQLHRRADGTDARVIKSKRLSGNVTVRVLLSGGGEVEQQFSLPDPGLLITTIDPRTGKRIK